MTREELIYEAWEYILEAAVTVLPDDKYESGMEYLSREDWLKRRELVYEICANPQDFKEYL